MSIEELQNVNNQVFDSISRNAWSLSIAYRKGMRFDRVYGKQQDKLVSIFMFGMSKMNEAATNTYEDCVIPMGLSQVDFNKFISYLKRTYHGGLT